MVSLKNKKRWYVFLGILIVLVLYTLKNTSYLLRASTFIGSILLFYLIDYLFKLKFRRSHYLIFIFFSITGVLCSPLFFIYPNYDKILHFVNPVLLGILIFYLVNKLEIQLSTKLLITFSFLISVLALFEIGEYLMDVFFDLKLQGVYLRDYSGVEKLNIIMDRNDDTMIDMILGCIGGLIFVSYQYTKTKLQLIIKK